jgi:hypothetical protein
MQNYLFKIFIFLLFINTFFLNASEIQFKLKNLVESAFSKESGKSKLISLAANNKMLSQKIAKNAVKIYINYDRKKAKKEILKDAKEFHNTLISLLGGNKNINAKVESKLAKKEIKEIINYWKRYYKSVVKLEKNPKDKKAFNYIYKNNEKLLGLTHKLTQTLMSERAITTNFSAVVEHTHKFLDRERFLTQKMFKEALLIFKNIDKKRNITRSHGSVILFEHALDAMLKGDKKRGIVPISNPKMKKLLINMKKEWDRVKNIYKFKIKKLTLKDIKLLDKASNNMLLDTQKLIKLAEDSLIFKDSR